MHLQDIETLKDEKLVEESSVVLQHDMLLKLIARIVSLPLIYLKNQNDAKLQ